MIKKLIFSKFIFDEVFAKTKVKSPGIAIVYNWRAV